MPHQQNLDTIGTHSSHSARILSKPEVKLIVSGVRHAQSAEAQHAISVSDARMRDVAAGSYSTAQLPADYSSSLVPAADKTMMSGLLGGVAGASTGLPLQHALHLLASNASATLNNTSEAFWRLNSALGSTRPSRPMSISRQAVPTKRMI